MSDEAAQVLLIGAAVAVVVVIGVTAGSRYAAAAASFGVVGYLAGRGRAGR